MSTGIHRACLQIASHFYDVCHCCFAGSSKCVIFIKNKTNIAENKSCLPSLKFVDIQSMLGASL